MARFPGSWSLFLHCEHGQKYKPRRLLQNYEIMTWLVTWSPVGFQVEIQKCKMDSDPHLFDLVNTMFSRLDQDCPSGLVSSVRHSELEYWQRTITNVHRISHQQSNIPTTRELKIFLMILCPVFGLLKSHFTK